jgi:hypothetical protein
MNLADMKNWPTMSRIVAIIYKFQNGSLELIPPDSQTYWILLGTETHQSPDTATNLIVIAWWGVQFPS